MRALIPTMLSTSFGEVSRALWKSDKETTLGFFGMGLLPELATPWWMVAVLVPGGLLAAAYLLSQKLRHRYVVRFANLELLNRVAPKRPGYSRHAAPVLLLSALLVFSVSLARPQSERSVPVNRTTVILAIDSSLSMESTDVLPSRKKAAQEAAKDFIESVHGGVNIGLVSFSGVATVLSHPTNDKEMLQSIIDRIELSERTATGEAIFASLQVIDSISASLPPGEGPAPSHIVLLADGKQTVPPDYTESDRQHPRHYLTASRLAEEKGVPVSTIAFGTALGFVEIEGSKIDVPVDEDSLKEIADVTGGQFFSASTEGQLRSVYESLDQIVGYELQKVDVSHRWTLVGVVLIFLTGIALIFRYRSIN